MAVGSRIIIKPLRDNLVLKMFNFLFFFKSYFIFKFYIIVLVLPNIKINPPQVYTFDLI